MNITYDFPARFTYVLQVIELLSQPVTSSTDNILWKLRSPSETVLNNQSN